MKNKINIFLLLIIAVFISSCNNNSNKIDVVKLIPVKIGSNFEYINSEGKIIINPQFLSASSFYNGLGLVKTTGDNPKWGFINEEGKYVINAQYKEATTFKEGLAWVITENSVPVAIDDKGEIKITMQDAEKIRSFNDGLAAYSIINDEGNEMWGFIDKSGKVIINPQFIKTNNFHNNLCAVKNEDGKWGYIDKTGLIKINHQFDYAKDFNNNYSVVEFDGKYGVINNLGKYIINPQFNNIINDNDIFVINQDGKWGWSDKEGKIIINPQFEEAYPFMGNNLTSVKSGGKYGYIDKEGKIIINPQFDGALPFNGGIALVQLSSKIGFIDKEGKYVINPQFDGISEDFVMLLMGENLYNQVETDFFNIDAIVSVINFDNPEGFDNNSRYSDVMKTYELTKSDFNKWRDYKNVISNKKINKDASYNFMVMGNPYKKVVSGRDWYGDLTYKYTFNDSIKVVGYKYQFELQGKGYGKEDDIITSIESKLNDFKKIGDDHHHIFVKEGLYIDVWKRHSSVFVYIKFLTEEKYKNIIETINESKN